MQLYEESYNLQYFSFTTVWSLTTDAFEPINSEVAQVRQHLNLGNRFLARTKVSRGFWIRGGRSNLRIVLPCREQMLN